MSQNIIVISGPSGAGKGVLIETLLKRVEGLVLAVSATTRLPREHEQDGRDYYFLSQEQFDTYVNEGKFVEFCPVHDCFYGTLIAEFERIHEQGKIALLEIDTQGAAKVKQRYPGAFTVFIAPPDLDILKQRLLLRGTETTQQIERRLKTAEQEMKKIGDYDFVLINDKIDDSSAGLCGLVQKRFKM